MPGQKLRRRIRIRRLGPAPGRRFDEGVVGQGEERPHTTGIAARGREPSLATVRHVASGRGQHGFAARHAGVSKVGMCWPGDPASLSAPGTSGAFMAPNGGGTVAGSATDDDGGRHHAATAAAGPMVGTVSARKDHMRNGSRRAAPGWRQDRIGAVAARRRRRLPRRPRGLQGSMARPVTVSPPPMVAMRVAAPLARSMR